MNRKLWFGPASSAFRKWQPPFFFPLRYLLAAISVCASLNVHAFSCAAVPTTLNGGATPVAAGAGDLEIGNNSTLSTTTSACTVVNGTTCTNATGDDTTLTQGTGVGPPSQTLPAFQPTTFPPVGTTNVSKSHNTSLVEGAYKKVTTAGTVTFTGGTYYIDELIADKSGSNQPTLIMAAGDYFIRNFEGKNNLTIQVSSGPVRIFIKEDWDVGNDAAINAGGTPSDLQIFAYDNAELKFGNNENSNTDVDFVGLIYAPGSGTEITMGNNNVIQGAVLSGGSVDLGNNISVIYDATTQAAIASINTCSLSGNWRMDETTWSSGGTIADSSGSGLNGTLSASASAATAKVCNGANLNGSAYITVANNPRLQLSGGGTITMWIKPSDTTNRWLFGKGTEYYAYLDSAGKVVFGWGTSLIVLPSPKATSATSVSTNVWTHIAIRLDDAAGKIHIHLNGSTTPDVTATTAIAITNGSSDLTIGNGFWSDGFVFNGSMDEVKIFKGLALSATDINEIYTQEAIGKNFDGTARACPSSGPHHLEISDSSGGAGLTCSPTTLTIKACADSQSPCTPHTTGVTGTLTATPVSGSPTVIWGNGSGAFTIAAGSNSVTKTLQVTTPNSSVTIGTTSLVPVASAATTCTFTSPANNCRYTAADSGFLVTAAARYACAAQSVTLQAVQSNATGTVCNANSSFNSKKKTITLHAKDVNAANTTGAVSLRYASSNGGATTTVNPLGTSAATATTLTDLWWDSTSTATLSNFTYADAGQLQLYPFYSGADGLTLSAVGGATVIVAPKSFEFTSMPAEPWQAGTTYTTAKLTAKHDVDAASDIVACRSAGATVNFGKEVTPQSPTLSATRTEPTGTNTRDGTTSLSVGSFTSGEGDLSLMWSEVGTLALNGSISSYLGSGLSATTGARNVRFSPGYFDLTLVPQTGCSGFVYSGQPFGVVVKAYSNPWSVSGVPTATVTENYDGTPASTPNYAHAVSLSETTGAAGNLTNATVAAAKFTKGTATVVAASGTPTWTFTATTPMIPTPVVIRATDSSDTSITSSGHETNAGTTVRLGRVRMSNAHGSELLPLPVPLVIEYYQSAAMGWQASTGDTCTTLAPTNFALAFGGTGNNLTTGETTISISGSGPTPAVSLSRPGAGNNGWTDITLNLDAIAPWLKFNWTGSGPTNPTTRATFGIYRSGPTIHRREMY